MEQTGRDNPPKALQRVVKVRRDYNTWIANETMEDYALRFTPRSYRKWTESRVANTAFGAAAFLVLEAVGATRLSWPASGRLGTTSNSIWTATRHCSEVSTAAGIDLVQGGAIPVGIVPPFYLPSRKECHHGTLKTFICVD